MFKLINEVEIFVLELFKETEYLSISFADIFLLLLEVVYDSLLFCSDRVYLS